MSELTYEEHKKAEFDEAELLLISFTQGYEKAKQELAERTCSNCKWYTEFDDDVGICKSCITYTDITIQGTIHKNFGCSLWKSKC